MPSPLLWTKLHRLWMMVVVGAAYAYELRQDDQVLSTGRLTMDDALAPGDEVTVARIVALVNELTWVGGKSRLLLEPLPSPSRSRGALGSLREQNYAVEAR
jgi:hypothetical protein